MKARHALRILAPTIYLTHAGVLFHDWPVPEVRRHYRSKFSDHLVGILLPQNRTCRARISLCAKNQILQFELALAVDGEAFYRHEVAALEELVNGEFRQRPVTLGPFLPCRRKNPGPLIAL